MSGFLPKEISQLTELEEINFTGNKISGNIPSEWSSLIKLGKSIFIFDCVSLPVNNGPNLINFICKQFHVSSS